MTKLLINVGAVAVLLAYLPTLSTMADGAAIPPLPGDDLGKIGTPTMIHPALALLLVLAVTMPAGYTPQGRTRYRQRGRPARAVAAPTHQRVFSTQAAMEV